MMPFLSDRRVLATSAAVITVAILAFLIGTYPAWRKAIGPDGSGLTSLMQPGASGPGSDSPGKQASIEKPAPDGGSTQENATAPASPAAGEPSASSASASPHTADGTEGAKDDGKTPVGVVTLEPGDQSGAADQGPSFDIVRVEPSGDSVIAGRAKPGADIVLLDQGQPIARAKADANGQVAFVPPALAPGEHSLMLSVGEPNQSGTVSSQSVAVSVPAEGKTAPMVALLAPGQPTRVLSAPAPSATTGPATATAPPVAVSSIDVEEQGGIYATGKAAPNSHCRIYLNGAFVAAVTAGQDGVWSLKIKRGMRPGRYSVRVDQLQSAAGQVQARAEVPFDYPDRVADGASLLRPKVAAKATGGPGPQADGSLVATRGSAAPAPLQTSPASSAKATEPVTQTVTAEATAGQTQSGVETTIVPQLLTTKVIRGDSLWRISRKMLGHGLRYTQIYAANTTQIRDPKLIYPGQIFVMPQSTQ